MIKIGTDCSGIEAPIQALQQLNIQHQHVFSSDIDKFVIKSIKANYNPEIIFGDISKRDIKDVPDIDVYIAGFPCQTFSSAGNRKGFEDTTRGTVFFSCLHLIKHKRPKVFILENVKGLLTHDKGNTFKIILDCLKDLEYYNIDYKLLNTNDYGIPQSRPRVYIVGILKSERVKEFNFPEKKPMIPLLTFVDNDDNSTNKVSPSIQKIGLLNKIPTDAVFVDFSFKNNKFPMSGTLCPCLLSNHLLWCVPKGRYVNLTEKLSLQGFPKDFKQVVSKTQLDKQIGNSMSVNVLKELFIEIFKCTNILQ
jgi:DNA (cytosine-5)-methyltransferase 1